MYNTNSEIVIEEKYHILYAGLDISGVVIEIKIGILHDKIPISGIVVEGFVLKI